MLECLKPKWKDKKAFTVKEVASSVYGKRVTFQIHRTVCDVYRNPYLVFHLPALPTGWRYKQFFPSILINEIEFAVGGWCLAKYTRGFLKEKYFIDMFTSSSEVLPVLTEEILFDYSPRERTEKSSREFEIRIPLPSLDCVNVLETKFHEIQYRIIFATFDKLIEGLLPNQDVPAFDGMNILYDYEIRAEVGKDWRNRWMNFHRVPKNVEISTYRIEHEHIDWLSPTETTTFEYNSESKFKRLYIFDEFKNSIDKVYLTGEDGLVIEKASKFGKFFEFDVPASKEGSTGKIKIMWKNHTKKPFELRFLWEYSRKYAHYSGMVLERIDNQYLGLGQKNLHISFINHDREKAKQEKWISAGLLNINNDTECPISYDRIRAGDTIRSCVACRHAFLEENISAWLSKNTCCPYCRSERGEWAKGAAIMA